jgi:hypothetical protein
MEFFNREVEEEEQKYFFSYLFDFCDLTVILTTKFFEVKKKGLFGNLSFRTALYYSPLT